MNNCSLLTLIVVLGLPAGWLVAQEEIVHSVAFPAGDSAWTVTLQRIKATPQHGTGEQPQAKEIVKVDVLRKGNLRRDTVHWSDSSTTEYWWSQEPLVVVFESGTDTAVRSMKPALMAERRLDESMFSGVSADSFAGPKSINGKSCLYYETKKPVTDGEPELRQIWLDRQTRVPVAWSDGNQIMAFSFRTVDPASGPLIVPPKFLTELQRYASYVAPPKRAVRR